MIGILLVAHDTLAAGMSSAVCHVLGSLPPNFEFLAVSSNDDPYDLLPQARAMIKALDTGEGVIIFTDIFGATPSNLTCKLLVPGRVEGIAGVSLPMLIRAFTYRNHGMDTMLKKAISGARDGALHINSDPVYAASRT